MYGLFADPAAIARGQVSGILPGGAIDAAREQLTRVASKGPRDGPPRHEYLQLVAKTLYTVDSFFHAPGASNSGHSLVESCIRTQQISSPEVVELRKEAGLWLKALREKRGLSERQMAEKVGGNYYTFISQLKSGRGRIPPDRYFVWAEVLGVEPKFFVRNLLKCYDPVTYSILFGKSKPQR